MRVDRILAHNLNISRSVAASLCRQGCVRDIKNHVLANPAIKLRNTDFPMQVYIDDQLHTCC